MCCGRFKRLVREKFKEPIPESKDAHKKVKPDRRKKRPWEK